MPAFVFGSFATSDDLGYLFVDNKIYWNFLLDRNYGSHKRKWK